MAAKKPARDDIDAFIAGNIRHKDLPPDAVADLVYFAEQADEGRVVSAQGILKWLEQKYGLKMSRTKLYNEFGKASLTPWFSR